MMKREPERRGNLVDASWRSRGGFSSNAQATVAQQRLAAPALSELEKQLNYV